MSELGEVLELLHRAHARYRTVHLTAREWQHNERLLDAYDAAARAAGGSALPMARDESLAAESEVRIRGWFEQPNRVREERDDESGTCVAASDGRRWWTMLPGWATIAEDGDGWSRGHVGDTVRPLLDPSRISGLVDLDVQGREEVAGRAAHVVLATPRPDVHADLHLLGRGADGHELLVDAERGVVLGATSSRLGEPFMSIHVDEIAFDDPVEPALFAHRPAADERVVALRDSVGEDVTIEEAARRAAFTVLSPVGLGRGWQMFVLYTPGAEGTRMRETVTLSLFRDDATHSITIRQTVPPFERWQLNGTEHAERDGRVLRIGAAVGWRRVLVEERGTAVELSSGTVDADELVQLAFSLAPAPSELPPLLS